MQVTAVSSNQHMQVNSHVVQVPLPVSVHIVGH